MWTSTWYSSVQVFSKEGWQGSGRVQRPFFGQGHRDVRGWTIFQVSDSQCPTTASQLFLLFLIFMTKSSCLLPDKILRFILPASVVNSFDAPLNSQLGVFHPTFLHIQDC